MFWVVCSCVNCFIPLLHLLLIILLALPSLFFVLRKQTSVGGTDMNNARFVNEKKSRDMLVHGKPMPPKVIRVARVLQQPPAKRVKVKGEMKEGEEDEDRRRQHRSRYM